MRPRKIRFEYWGLVPCLKKFSTVRYFLSGEIFILRQRSNSAMNLLFVEREILSREFIFLRFSRYHNLTRCRFYQVKCVSRSSAGPAYFHDPHTSSRLPGRSIGLEIQQNVEESNPRIVSEFKGILTTVTHAQVIDQTRDRAN